MIGTTGSMPIQGLFSLTRKVSHTINRPLSKALETCSSVSIASLNAWPAYLGDTTNYSMKVIDGQAADIMVKGEREDDEGVFRTLFDQFHQRGEQTSNQMY